ncbi:MAG TPA: hypothetical protein PKW37_08310, partial [Salinivirgaceae bacterium]|nr:hypothetical protein [Salinivirgaceae bacterium]
SFLNNGKSLGDQQFAFNFEYKNKIFTGIELMLNHGYLGGAAWGALYSKKLLFANKVLFPEGIKNGEDSIFAALCQIYSKKVIFLDLHFYNVFERDGSASRSWSFDRLALMPNNLKFINDYKSSHPNLSTEALNILDYRMFAFIRHMFNLFYKMFNIRNYMILRGKIKKELKSKLNIGKIRHHKNQVKLLNFSLDFFAFAVFFNNLFFKKNY